MVSMTSLAGSEMSLVRSGRDVVGQLAAAALHVDVGGVAALEGRVELGEHVLVLHRVDLRP